jgi:competence protein ComEC
MFALNKWKPLALESRSEFSNSIFSEPALVQFAGAFLLLLFALIIFHPFSSPKIDGRLHIDFLDVGQGDAALITFPNGETLLIDGGGKANFNRINAGTEMEPEIFEPDTRSVGEAVVSEFLWEKGYSQIDYILATHADADHIQGLSDVAKNFRVRAALFGRTQIRDAEFAALFSILQRRKIEIMTLSRGDVLTFGEVKVQVLNPPPDDFSDDVSDNNNSLVLRVVYGERKFLLTSDVERETEKKLLDAPEFLQADVIKVAHHGSRTSSIKEFVNASKVKVAVVSVGKESPYGHPHGEVVERWKNAGAKVLTTGENGTISISTDGQDLQMITFRREKIYR